MCTWVHGSVGPAVVVVVVHGFRVRVMVMVQYFPNILTIRFLHLYFTFRFKTVGLIVAPRPCPFGSRCSFHITG